MCEACELHDLYFFNRVDDNHVMKSRLSGGGHDVIDCCMECQPASTTRHFNSKLSYLV